MITVVRRLFALLIVALFAGYGHGVGAQGNGLQRGTTGLPLPRFVSLRASEVNMRTGPGVQYPVEWVYQRQGLPVEIIAEFGTWRKVRDWQGTQGWVHQSMLTGRRTLIVTGAERTVRAQSNINSPAVAQAESGVIGRILFCAGDSNWCRVDLADHEGWLRRVEFWGIYRDENIE